MREGKRHQEEQQKEACSKKNYAVLVVLNSEVTSQEQGARAFPGTRSAFSAPTYEVPLAGWWPWPQTGSGTLWCTGAHPRPPVPGFSVSPTCCLPGAPSLASQETQDEQRRRESTRGDGEGPRQAETGCPSCSGAQSLWAAGKWQCGNSRSLGFQPRLGELCILEQATSLLCAPRCRFESQVHQ